MQAVSLCSLFFFVGPLAVGGNLGVDFGHIPDLLIEFNRKAGLEDLPGDLLPEEILVPVADRGECLDLLLPLGDGLLEYFVDEFAVKVAD